MRRLCRPQKWEQKLLASNVAQFEPAAAPAASSSRQPPQPAPPPIPPLPKAELNPSHQQMLPPMGGSAGLSLNLGMPGLALPVPRPGGGVIGSQASYGQQVYGQQQAQAQQAVQGQQQQPWNGGLRGGAADDKGKGPARLRGGAGEDGDHYAIVVSLPACARELLPASACAACASVALVAYPLLTPASLPCLLARSQSESDSSDDDSDASSSIGSPKKPAAAPAAPSVPAPRPQANEHGIFPGDEEINSDLDDTDDELDDDENADVGADADADIVFCVYDKVRRSSTRRLACPLALGLRPLN